MLKMENAEEVMQILERFTRLKQKEIPKELDDYMHYVAKTGDTVFKWSSLKYLFREKLLNVIKNFHDTSPRVDDLPQYPNVDPFNYESMKSSLLERLELFNAAPFTVQRLCELLTEPRKQYSRIDKFMRALEKNILVSTIEPGRKRTESENGDSLDSVVNGDASLEVNVDIDMENEAIFNAETQNNATSSSQPSSNLIHKSDDDILPNPKKAKLDLDETHDAETEAATKSIISNNKTDTTVDSSSDDNKIIANDDTNDITETKKDEEEPARAASAEEKTASTTVADDADIADHHPIVESSKDNKESEVEKMEDDSAVVSTTDDKIPEQKEKKTDEEVVDSTETTLVEAVAVAADQTNESSPICTSAAEAADSTEKTEKLDDEPEQKTKDCTEVVLEKQDTTEEIVAEKAIRDDKTDDTDAVKENNENNEKNEKTETTITTTTTTAITATNGNSELTADKLSASEKVEDKPEEATITTTTSTTKDAPEEVTTTTAVVEEPKSVVITPSDDSKPEVVVPSAKPDVQTKSEEAKPVEESESLASTVASDEAKAPSSENSTDAVEKIDAAAHPTPAAVTETTTPQEQPLDIPVDIQSAESQETESAKPVEITVAATQPAESKEVPVPIVVAATVPTDDNSLANADDQPMDENLESIAEAEPEPTVVPTIVVEAAPTVEEVVMADGGGSVEMATDVIEPSKEEPAGMEVDDTSQEAMDQ